MRIPSLLIATALLGSSAWAQHDDSHNYLQLGLGGVFSEEAQLDATGFGGTIGFDPGASISIAYGRSFRVARRLSVEAEIESYYQFFTVDEDDIDAIASAVQDDAKAFALMLNGLVEWHLTPQFGIFGGAGFGYASVIEYSAWDSGNLSTVDDDGSAYQGRLGLDFNLGGTTDLRVNYHYFKTSPIEVHDEISGLNDEIDVAQHAFEVAVRWGL